MIWRWFWREWRTPSLLIVWLAFTLAVACVLALSSISERMTNSLNQKSRDFLAGDRVLRSNYPADPQWLAEAEKRGLTISRQISFMTMSFANDKLQLTQVKATDQHYPLYGVLITKPPQLNVQPGTVLVAPRLLSLLALEPGDYLEVGDARLQIAGQLIEEPDAGFTPFQTAPRLLMDLSDIEQTGAIQPGSRLTYRYMFAGSEQAIAQYSQFISQHLNADQRWLSVENSGNTLERSLKRANSFLLLSAVLTLLLSTAAIVVAMNHYCRSRYDVIAILKTLGAGKNRLQLLIIGQWLLLISSAYLIGCLLGIAFEASLIYLLRSVLPPELAAASWHPWGWSLALLVIISLLVGLRPYKQLLATPPLRVLRQDLLTPVWPLRYYLPIMAMVILISLYALIGWNTLWWIVLFAVVILALLLGVIAWLSLLILRRLTVTKISLRLAINRLLRQPWSSLSQLSTFALSFMLLTLLLLLRGDLLERWQQQLPPDTPNYFVLNIASAQRDQVKLFLQQQQIAVGDFYPIVLARLSQINDQPASQLIAADTPGYEAIDRELSLTWLDKQRITNPIVAGNWPPKMGEVSIDQGLAGRLNVTLGSKLTFTSAGGDFSATISSLRKVDWQSLQANFYFIFPAGSLNHLPQSWLTSFHWQGNEQQINQFNRQFPTLTLLDINNILDQVNQIIGQVSQALEIMVVLVIVCGFLLLLAQLQVGMQLRKQEINVYRILGASRTLLQATLFNEFALLGLAAGIAAVIGSEVALYMLQSQIFDFSWQANYWMWIIVPLAGSGLLSLCGGWLARRLV